MGRQKVFRFDPRVQLLCEWQACTNVRFGDDLDEFKNHIRAHANREARVTKLDQLTCLWSGCGEVTFNSVEEFKLHVNYHSYHMKLMCYGSISMEEMSKHFGREIVCSNDKTTRTILPDLPERFTCLWNGCGSCFDVIDDFFPHVTAHVYDSPALPEDPVRCRWHECEWVSRNRSQMKVHLKTHTQEKDIACPTCGFLFSERQKFRDHVLRQVKLKPEDVTIESSVGTSEEDPSAPPPEKRAKNNPIQCSNCREFFLSKRLLDQHKRSHCIPCVCQECGLVASNADSLNKHMTYRHSEERPFPCQFCSCKFKFRRDLRKHLFVHNPDSFVLQCNLCPFSARSTDTIALHKRNVHQDKKVIYQCHLCAVQCSRGNNMSRHLVTAHGLVPQPGHVKFRYAQDVNDQLYRMVDMSDARADSSELNTGSPVNPET